MELTHYCDSTIVFEYLRLKNVLDSMPRYKVGMHGNLQVIREYTGTGNKTVRRITHMNSRNYSEMHQNMLLYNEYAKRKKLFEEEMKRRHIPVSEEFTFKSDPSVFNAGFWNELVPCANTREIHTNYYDDYGYHVRSRGEMLIGNALKKLGLEAKYEPCLILKGGRKIHPDYSFPVHVIDRCFFIEFMGMSENEEYLNYNYGKIDEYMRNGILPNRDLILICGTDSWLPTQEAIMRIIASFINTAVESVYNRKS